MAWHALSEKEVFTKLHSSEKGLSNEEAELRLQQYGRNEITRKKKISAWKILLEQFNDFLIWILLVAAVVSGFVGEVADVVLISIILIANGILGFVQEYRAEEAIEALRKMASLKAIVFRDGKKQDIDATTGSTSGMEQLFILHNISPWTLHVNNVMNGALRYPCGIHNLAHLETSVMQCFGPGCIG